MASATAEPWELPDAIAVGSPSGRRLHPLDVNSFGTSQGTVALKNLLLVFESQHRLQAASAERVRQEPESIAEYVQVMPGRRKNVFGLHPAVGLPPHEF